MRRLFPLGLSLALALTVCTLSRPAAAAEEPQAIATATGDPEPLTFAWVDDKDGKVSLDSALATQVQDLLAGIRWLFLDNRRLVLGHQQGNTLETVYDPHLAGNADNTYFIFHQRSADRKTFINGTAFRFTDQPAQGYAYFTLLLLGDDGSSATVHVEQALSFASTTNDNGGTRR